MISFAYINAIDVRAPMVPVCQLPSVVRAPMVPVLQLHLVDVMLLERRFHFHVGVTINGDDYSVGDLYVILSVHYGGCCLD